LLLQVNDNLGLGLAGLQRVMEKLPEIQHDLNYLQLRDSYDDDLYDPNNLPYYRDTFSPWLMTVYDAHDNEENPPSLGVVILRSLIQSLRKSKYYSLGRYELRNIDFWLFYMKKHETDLSKGDLLWELLQNPKLEASQRVETEAFRHRLGVSPAYYKRDCVWRTILMKLKEGATQMNEKGQYPLHVLLANGLPGQDILLAANPNIADMVCPVEDMHPFLLAARKRDYDPPTAVAVAENEKLQSSLDLDHLSQTYSLLRANPMPVENFVRHLNLEYDAAFSAESKEHFDDTRRLDQKKTGLKKRKRELEELEKEIEEDEDALAKKSEALAQMRVFKK
jgi:hypothetical protein